jgi:FlgD Ig-like domain
MPVLRPISGRCLAAMTALLVLAAAPRANAAWPLDSHSGVPLCTATGDQTGPQIVSDESGGAIVVWADLRSGTADIYAQRVSRNGEPMWAPNGIAVCTVSGAQTLPRAIADGQGGVIVAWQDARGANLDVYAQHVDAGGARLWAAAGVPISTATADQTSVAMTGDGAGGAIVAWVDSRAGFLLEDIYAQRVNGAGATQWTANGVPLCTAASFQVEPAIVTDGSGGAIVTWTDWRGTSDIYAQRVNAAGAAQWTANGVAVCTAASLQQAPVVAVDGAGGAIIAWTDARTSGSTSTDVFMQRIGSSGAPLWTLDGVAVCAATGAQSAPVIGSDGAGGVDIVWEDRTSPASPELHREHIGANGYSFGPPCGYFVNYGEKASLVRTGPTPVAGHATGTAPNHDVGLVRLVNDQSYTGLACDAPGEQTAVVVAADDHRGVLVAWQDARSGQADIYAHRLDNYMLPGITEPVITRVRDVVHDQGGAIQVSWVRAFVEILLPTVVQAYRVWRAIPPDYAIARAGAAEAGVVESAVFRPERGAIVHERTATAIVYWEYLGEVPISGDEGYSFIVPTIGDSVAGWNPVTRVKVQIVGTSDPPVSLSWDSAPDSGYSVDNLAPATPVAFAGAYTGGQTAMTWNANVESDLAGYRLYRGSSPAFVPSPANRVAEPTQPHHTDPAGSPYVYKLTAVDVHGNESPAATLIPSGTTDVPGTTAAFFLASPAPHPARLRDGVAFRFGLAVDATARLAVHDLSGRCVRVVASGPAGPGEHTVRWDGRDSGGHRVAPGAYVVRLTAGDREESRRLVLIE